MSADLAADRGGILLVAAALVLAGVVIHELIQWCALAWRERHPVEPPDPLAITPPEGAHGDA